MFHAYVGYCPAGHFRCHFTVPYITLTLQERWRSRRSGILVVGIVVVVGEREVLLSLRNRVNIIEFRGAREGFLFCDRSVLACSRVG